MYNSLFYAILIPRFSYYFQLNAFVLQFSWSQYLIYIHI